MALQFVRGIASIEAAAKGGSGGGFRPFIPRVEWREDGESKYIVVLTPMEEVTQLLLHEWIPVGKGEKANGEEYTRWETFASRKDVALGEDYDDLEERLEREPKLRHLGVMAELEPVVKTEDGRKKVKGFVVKTDTYTRKDDDGEVEITQPMIGIATGASLTLWDPFKNLYNSQGDIAELPIEVTRNGKDRNTRYNPIPYLDVPVDFSPIIEYADGLSYISDDLDDLIGDIDAASSDLEAAQVISNALLTKRLDELTDKDRYEELVAPLELDDMPKNKFGKKEKKETKKTRSARPQRTTRRAAKEEAKEEATETTVEKPKAEPKTDRFAALKARVENKS